MWSKSSRYKQASILVQSLQSPKEGYFLFEQIKCYLNKVEKGDIRQTISDKTSTDLDLDEVFMFTDRTISKVGQQCFYHVLRTIPKNENRTNAINKLIDSLHEHPEIDEEITHELSKLQSGEAYGIVNLFFRYASFETFLVLGHSTTKRIKHPLFRFCFYTALIIHSTYCSFCCQPSFSFLE